MSQYWRRGGGGLYFLTNVIVLTEQSNVSSFQIPSCILVKIEIGAETVDTPTPS